MDGLLFLVVLVGFAVLIDRYARLTRRLDGLDKRAAQMAAEIARLQAERPPQPSTHADPVTAARFPSGPVLQTAPPPAAPTPPEPRPDGGEPEKESAQSPPTPKAPRSGERLRSWLEENGLAWAGGAALALGGLFLATYAAQRGVFTPALRIALAVAVGAGLVAVSEWLRRRAETDERGHKLAASLSAGAGAATLYGAAWAAHGLYGLIGPLAAAPLMAGTSAGLLVLAFRHGEPLAILALAGGFLAPIITETGMWPTAALIGYLALLAATGYGVAAERSWARAGLATLVCMGFWSLLALLAGAPFRASAVVVGSAALALGARAWSERRSEAPPPGGFARLAPAAFLTAAAVCGLTLALLGSWEAAGGAAALLALGAWGLRRGWLSPMLQTSGYLAAAAAVFWAPPAAHGLTHAGSLGALALILIGAGVLNALERPAADARWAGAAAATALALVVRIAAPEPFAWAPEAMAAALLLLAAGAIRRRADPEETAPAALWIWTAGGAAIAAVTEAADPRVAPVALAALALGVSLLHARLRWRGFAAPILAASLAALGSLLTPAMLNALGGGGLAWPAFAALAALSAGLIYLAARLTRRREEGLAPSEGLSTAALVIGLAGAFLLLRYGAGEAIDPFVEASLRTLLLLVAGLSAALAAPAPERQDRAGEKIAPALVEEAFAAFVSREGPGVIGRWRGQALLLLGLVHGLFFQLLGFNPLVTPWPVAGPPLLDSLLLGYLAPAILLGVATHERVSLRRPLLTAFAGGAGVFALAWQLLETRRLFQSATLNAGRDLIGRAEAAAYALVLLGAAAAALWLAALALRRRLPITPLAPALRTGGLYGAWGALAFAVLVFGYAASPWWGPIQRPLDSPAAAALLLGLYGAGTIAVILLGLRLSGAGSEALTRALRLCAVVIGFAFLNVLVRAGFRGLDMRPDLREASLETWTFSAVWGVFGLALLVYGAARASRDLRLAGLAVLFATLAKIFLFDMARLDGVVRAASFLAVGGLLMAAAVLTRRLSGRFGADRPPSPEGPAAAG